MSYIYKNVYFMNSHITFKDKISIFMTSRTVRFKMYSDYENLLDKEKFVVTDNRDDLHLYVLYDTTLVDDAYDLEITKKAITIKSHNERGLRYAFKVLNSLVKKEDGYKLPIIRIFDEPSFVYRGVIEGYYFTPWSTESRLTLADFLDEYRLNTYMYAPKSDIYHREKWAELYPEAELNDLIKFKESLEAKYIDFFYCLSPGYAKNKEKEFKLTDEEEFNRLFSKYDQMINVGVNKFGLLLDDIDYKLNAENKLKFKRPGIAHAYLTNRVYEYLKSKVDDLVFVMCPTEYHQIGESEYRSDLKERLHKDIKVFWTGDNVCAEVITDSDARLTKEAFGHDLFIWDNFPVSDFTYGVRTFLAPIRNRTVDLNKYASGYIINPMNLYESSKIGMISQAHYAWNSARYDIEKSFEESLKYFGEDFYNVCKDFIFYNYPNVLNHGNLEYERWLVENEKYEEIKAYVGKASKSAINLKKLDLPIISELKPWLDRCEKEEIIINQIIDNKVKKEDLLVFLEDIKFSGSKILDLLVSKKGLLTEEEYTKLITKRRGGKWYRIWEDKK